MPEGREKMDRLVIDSSGRLKVPGTAAREIGGSSLELVSASSRHLFYAVPGRGGEVLLAGVLGDLTVADLLSFCNMFRKTGVLSFELSGGRKDLYFNQGEIVFASSTFPEEDLGEILFELGKVDRESLERVRQFASGRSSVGRILVEKQAVTAKDLWLAARTQVESVVYHLFGFHRGSFSFQLRSLEPEEVVRLSMSTQNLIMEGLRRIDERELFLRRIPSLEARPLPTGKDGAGLSGGEKKMMDIILAGQRDVRQALRECGAGEFDGLRLLYQLVEKGLVRIEEASAEPVDGPLGEMLSVGNGALSLLSRQVEEANPAFPQEVRRFLRNLPQPYSFLFRDVGLREDGTLDGGRILSNLEGLEEGDKERLLAEGLNELIYMECLAARRELGAAGSKELVQRAQEVGGRLVQRTGRKDR